MAFPSGPDWGHPLEPRQKSERPRRSHDAVGLLDHYKPKVHKLEDGISAVLVFEENDVQADHFCVTDDDEWYVRVPEIVTPAKLASVVGHASLSRHIGLVLPRAAPRQRLRERAAALAFKGMTVPLLQSLLDVWKVEHTPPRPRLEEELVTCLVAWALPKHTEQEVKDVVATRCQPRQMKLSTILSIETSTCSRRAVT